MSWLEIALLGLLATDQVLSSIQKPRSNSVYQLVVQVLTFLATPKTPPSEPKTPNLGGTP